MTKITSSTYTKTGKKSISAAAQVNSQAETPELGGYVTFPESLAANVHRQAMNGGVHEMR